MCMTEWIIDIADNEFRILNFWISNGFHSFRTYSIPIRSNGRYRKYYKIWLFGCTRTLTLEHWTHGQGAHRTNSMRVKVFTAHSYRLVHYDVDDSIQLAYYHTLSFMRSCFGVHCMAFDHQFFSRICTPNLGVSVAPVRRNFITTLEKKIIEVYFYVDRFKSIAC